MDKIALIPVLLVIALGAGLGALLGYYGKCTSGTCPLTANPVRGAVYGLVLAVLFVVPGFLDRSSENDTENISTESQVLHIDSTAAFEQHVLTAKDPVMVDFYSPTCGPCRKLGPTIDALAQTYKERAAVVKVNVDTVPQLAAKYNINSIPAVLFFSTGQEIKRIIGYNAQATYANVLNTLLSQQ